MLYSQKDSLSLELGTYYQRSIDRAQKRYLTAIKTLAQVRKLAVPILQAEDPQSGSLMIKVEV
jgi:hypothetical protein